MGSLLPRLPLSNHESPSIHQSDRPNKVEIFVQHVSNEIRLYSRIFYRSFALGFSLRALVSILGRILVILKRDPKRILSFSQLLGEKNLIFRVDATRLGLFFGAFSSSFYVCNRLYTFLCTKLDLSSQTYEYPNIPEKSGQQQDRLNLRTAQLFVSGASAALVSVLFLPLEMRKTLALYAVARAIQALLTHINQQGYFDHLIDQIPSISLARAASNLKNNINFITFCVTSATTMYAYVMCPETLPESYWNFIVRTGPIPKNVLSAVRHVCEHKAVPVIDLDLKGRLSPDSLLVPCSVLHPSQPICWKFQTQVWKDSFRKSLGLYLSINTISMVLNVKQLLRSPGCSLIKLALNTLQSTAFLASFVAIYQLVVCFQRKFVVKDFKQVYFIAGIFSSFSLLMEKRSRWTELAMNVAPRAIGSLYYQLKLPVFKGGEVVVFSLSCGILSSLFFSHPKSVPFLVSVVFKNLLAVPKAVQDE